MQHKNNKNNKFSTNLRFLMLALGTLGVALFFSSISLFPILRFGYQQAALITSLSGGAVGALSIAIVAYQLNQATSEAKHQSEIQESDFLFRYNQAFITNPDMTYIEMRLDQDLEGRGEFQENDADEHQKAINYLVYLESLAPLMLNDIISFSYADDLMAYRFFLAVNNPCIQKRHLFTYPHYYLGCFKLYKRWKNYRIEHHKEYVGKAIQSASVPIETYVKNYDYYKSCELDSWLYFEHFTADPTITVHCLADNDNATFYTTAIAALLYQADPYIYPAAFGDDLKRAANVIAYFIDNSISYFSPKNIFVVMFGSKAVGAMVLLDDSDYSDVDTEAVRRRFPWLPETFEYTCKKIFDTAKNDASNDCMYLCTLAVDEQFRKKHIAKRMIGEAILYHIIKDGNHRSKSIRLHVLRNNEAAIRLYLKCGFETDYDDVHEGFSVIGKKPDILIMTRNGCLEDVLATDLPERFNTYFMITAKEN